MARMQEPHRAQIEEMLKDGKDPEEVVEFMKKTYGISVKPHQIAYIKKTAGESRNGVATDEHNRAKAKESGKPKRGKRGRRAKGKPVKIVSGGIIHLVDPAQDLSDEQLKDMVFQEIHEISCRPRKLLMEIHNELEKIKVRMAKAAGLPESLIS